VIFDPSFDLKVNQMVKIVNQLKTDSFQNRTHELSSEVTKEDTSLVLPSSLHDEIIVPPSSHA
jgi:hypothetical protein